ncbi:MAG: sialate O-acetylesterase, partial [Bacteroidota bacterium]|nr:sialate O-acetylesterase [Bacteroidota bacterium]
MKNLIILFLLAISIHAKAQSEEFHLPSIISDHAVFQQSSSVKLWGWCPSVWTLKVVCSWNPSDTLVTKSGRDCAWETSINTPQAGGPYSIKFFGYQNKLVKEIKDIMIGEVWLCSGQSNMEFSSQWGVSDVGNAFDKTDNEEIRFFRVPHSYDNYPRKDCAGEWVVCNATTVANFSAIGYLFGRKINGKLKVPVGMIGSYWGGTAIQPWIPQETFQKDTALNAVAERILPKWTPVAQSAMYNAMINPFVKYKIAGVLWYQGEANAVDRQGSKEESTDYGKLFAGLITGWREVFHNDFPFYFVQIAPWTGYAGLDGALLREQQDLTLSVPKTAMVVVSDLVDDVKDVHPKKKYEVADRLANIALKEQYGIENLQPYSPRFANLMIKGNKAIVTINSVGKLNSKAKTIQGFQIAGADKTFYPAKAIIEKDGRIQLISEKVQKPVAVRYCFSNEAMPDLFDTNKLPLAP